MNPTQQDQQPPNSTSSEPAKSMTPPVPPAPSSVPGISPTQMAPDTAAAPPKPINPQPVAVSAHGSNPMKVVIPVVLFVLFLGLGVGLAIIIKSKANVAVTPGAKPMTEAVPSTAPSPSPVVTKSPEESQLDTIEVGSSEAELNKVQKSIDQL